MDFENLLLQIKMSREKTQDPKITEKIDELARSIQEQGEQVDPSVLDYFKDRDFFTSLPEAIQNNAETLQGYIINMSKFLNVITPERRKRWNGDNSGMLGDEVHIPETTHSDGRTRRAQSGQRINVEYLRSQGIDPSQVLFFRRTQPSTKPKPEYYWTSDYFETQRGLTREISGAQRDTSIILVASLDAINGKEGLIQDMNDDQGLAVRQIDTGNFDQNLAIAKISKNSTP